MLLPSPAARNNNDSESAESQISEDDQEAIQEDQGNVEDVQEYNQEATKEAAKKQNEESKERSTKRSKRKKQRK